MKKQDIIIALLLLILILVIMRRMNTSTYSGNSTVQDISMQIVSITPGAGGAAAAGTSQLWIDIDSTNAYWDATTLITSTSPWNVTGTMTGFGDKGIDLSQMSLDCLNWALHDNTYSNTLTSGVLQGYKWTLPTGVQNAIAAGTTVSVRKQIVQDTTGGKTADNGQPLWGQLYFLIGDPATSGGGMSRTTSSGLGTSVVWDAAVKSDGTTQTDTNISGIGRVQLPDYIIFAKSTAAPQAPIDCTYTLTSSTRYPCTTSGNPATCSTPLGYKQFYLTAYGKAEYGGQCLTVASGIQAGINPSDPANVAKLISSATATSISQPTDKLIQSTDTCQGGDCNCTYTPVLAGCTLTKCGTDGGFQRYTITGYTAATNNYPGVTVGTCPDNSGISGSIVAANGGSTATVYTTNLPCTTSQKPAACNIATKDQFLTFAGKTTSTARTAAQTAANTAKTAADTANSAATNAKNLASTGSNATTYSSTTNPSGALQNLFIRSSEATANAVAVTSAAVTFLTSNPSRVVDRVALKNAIATAQTAATTLTTASGVTLTSPTTAQTNLRTYGSTTATAASTALTNAITAANSSLTIT